MILDSFEYRTEVVDEIWHNLGFLKMKLETSSKMHNVEHEVK